MKIVVFYNKDKEYTLSAAKKIEAVCKKYGSEMIAVDNAKKAFSVMPSGAGYGIVLGGDGTMLDAASWASSTNTPLVGVNFGFLGYMNELEADETDKLSALFETVPETENRMMLDAKVYRKGENVFSCTSLNEVTICRGAVARLVDLELRCDNRTVSSYRADGLIVSTPTGSTAYSMSAGGPIIDPKLELILTSAVCPHGMTGSASMVFSPDARLGIVVSSKYHGDIYITSDGKSSFELCHEDEIFITKSLTVTKMVKLKNNAFYHTLSRKFNEKGV